MESDIFFEKIKKKQNEEETIFMNEKNSLLLHEENFIKPTKGEQNFDTNFYDKENEEEKNSLSDREAGSSVQYRTATNTTTSTTNVEEEMVSLLKYEKLKKENEKIKKENDVTLESYLFIFFALNF